MAGLRQEVSNGSCIDLSNSLSCLSLEAIHGQVFWRHCVIVGAVVSERSCGVCLAA